MVRTMWIRINSNDGTLEMSEKACSQLKNVLSDALAAKQDDGCAVIMDCDCDCIELRVEVMSEEDVTSQIYHCGAEDLR